MNYYTIEEFYTFIESSVKDLHIMNDEAVGLRQLINSKNVEILKRQLILETFVCEWSLEDGECKSHHSIVNKDGGVYEYPNYSSFEESDYTYLVQRAATVSNDFLIARYNQILWNSPKAHQQRNYLQVQAAVDAYLRILNSSDCTSDKKGGDCIDIFLNALELSAQVNYRVNDCKTLYKNWLYKDGLFHPHMKIILLQQLIENRRLKKVDFNGTLTLLEQLGAQNINEEDDVNWRQHIYEAGLKIAQRCNEETKSWNKNLGDCYVAMAEARLTDDSNMIPMEFYRNAISYYKAAGLTETIEKIERVISELRINVGLKEVSYTIEGDKAKIIFDFVAALSEKILECDSNDIYIHLATNPQLFPSKADINRTVKDGDADFLRVVKGIVFDSNNNISKVGMDSDTDIFFRNYGWTVKFNLQTVYKIFGDGLKSGKISYNSLITFLRDETWLGQTLTNKNNSGKLTQYNWLSVIAPSLHYYFVQAGIAANTSGIPVNYIIAIDSLTLKIEGLLREISKVCNISPMTTTRDGMMREKYIEELLAEPEIENFLGEDTLVFFQFFFTKKGANIRNDVAHSFYKHFNYSDVLMPILICAILKLSMFKLTLKECNNEAQTATV